MKRSTLPRREPLTLVLGTLLGLFSLDCAPSEKPRGAAGSGGEGDEGGEAGTGGGGGGGGGSGSGGQSGAGSGGSGGVAGGGGPPDAAVAGRDASPDGSDGGAPARDASTDVPTAKFSFFVTSIEAIRLLAGNPNGFGGNYGGLEGADSICQRTAAGVGFGHKTWRAFLSATKGPDGKPAHAIDRIGPGPWYDKMERLVSMDRAGLLMDRPAGNAIAVVDLTNENGVPQKAFGDNHDVITGSNRMGMLASTNPADTCNDWTSAAATGGGRPTCGHSWSRTGRQQWIQEHTVPGCAPGVNLKDNSVNAGNCIGCNGGYGGLYCFALTP
jgi:hypothetical protein